MTRLEQYDRNTFKLLLKMFEEIIKGKYKENKI
jgi:hypothetical protein